MTFCYLYEIVNYKVLILATINSIIFGIATFVVKEIFQCLPNLLLSYIH